MASKLWAEIWTRPGDANYGRVVDDPLEVEGDFHDGLNQIGNGGMQLSNRSPYFDDILVSDPDTPANSKSSTVKIFSEKDPTTPIFEWLPNQLFPSTSKNDPLVQVSGLGVKAMLGHARLEPYDWDGTDDWSCVDCDWSFGGTNQLINGGFENEGIPNGDFELGTVAYWSTSPGLNPIVSTAAARTGSFGGELSAVTVGTGWSRSVGNLSPTPAVYTITGWLRDPSASGVNFRAGVSGADTATHTNAYESGGYWWAELGNAAMGSGATNGAWQSFTLTFTAVSTGVGLVIEYNDAGTGPTFYIDDWAIVGNGAGLSPWEPFEAFGATVNVFERSTAQAHSGVASLRVQVTEGTDDRGGGISQTLDTTPGQTITFEAWVYQASGSNQDFLAILRRGGGGQDTGEGVSFLASSQTTVPTATWSKITVTGVTDFEETMVQVRMIGTPFTTGPVYFVDDAAAWFGLAATSVGEILRLLYDHAVDVDLRDPIVWDDGSGNDTPYLTLDFTDTLDSNGNAWDTDELQTKLTMRMSYSQVMAALCRDFGYEYRIVADDVETGTYLWQVYNPGTMQTDYTAAATPGIQGGAFDVRRNVNRFLPSGTDTLVEGLGRVTARARSSALMSALGRIEASRLNREAPDLTAASGAADESIDDLLTNSRSLSYTLVDPPDEPMSDYIIGDLLVVDDPPEVVASPARFVDVTCSFTPNTTEWETQFGSARIMNPDAAVASAVGGLLAKFEYPFPEPVTAVAGGGEGGGAPTIVIAAADASEFSKRKADYTCTGIDDHLTIQQALNSIDTGFGLGGRILLTEGTFNCNFGAIRLSDNTAQAPVHLQGCGYATILNFNAGAGTAIDVNGDRSIVSNLRMEGNSINSTAGIDITGFDCLITGVLFTDFGTGSANIVVSNGGTWCRIIGNLFDNNLQNAISVTVNAGATVISGNIIISQPGILANGDSVEITGNYIGAETGISGGGDDVQVTGNFINYTADGITANGIGWIINGNTFDGGSGWAVTNLSAFGDSEWVISGNTIRDSLGIELQDLTTDTIIADNFFEDGQIIFNGDVHNIAVRGNVWQTPVVDTVPAVIGFTGSLIDGVITDNLMDNAGGNTGVHIESGTDVLVANNQLKLTDVGIYLEACLRIVVSGNQVQWAGTHGIHISGSSLCTITGNKVFGSSVDTADTYDNIILDGDSDRNFISANQLGADTTIAARYGLNISANTCDITIAVGNDLGVVGDYGTDALNDAGTGTLLNYPSHGTYGDNFT